MDKTCVERKLDASKNFNFSPNPYNLILLRPPGLSLPSLIVLIKFDTIDGKVGAAVSMVYTAGQPIVFIGIGQRYIYLRKLNTKALVRALFKM